MSKSLVTGVAIGVAAAMAIGVAANYSGVFKHDSAPPPPETAMAEPANPMPANAEPASVEPAKIEPVKVEPTYAEVLKTVPVYKEHKTPRQVCKEETVTVKAPVKDENRVAGTALGAVLGGVLGNQIGHGNGKTLATVGGAVAGGYAGNQVQKNMQNNDVQTKQVTNCETVYDTNKEVVGYKVTYMLNGKRDTVRMDHDPGKRIPVRNGNLVLSEAN